MRSKHHQKGASLLEYSILLGLISLVALSAINGFGSEIKVGQLGPTVCELTGIPKSGLCLQQCMAALIHGGAAYSMTEAQSSAVNYCSS